MDNRFTTAAGLEQLDLENLNLDDILDNHLSIGSVMHHPWFLPIAGLAMARPFLALTRSRALLPLLGLGLYASSHPNLLPASPRSLQAVAQVHTGAPHSGMAELFSGLLTSPALIPGIFLMLLFTSSLLMRAAWRISALLPRVALLCLALNWWQTRSGSATNGSLNSHSWLIILITLFGAYSLLKRTGMGRGYASAPTALPSYTPRQPSVFEQMRPMTSHLWLALQPALKQGGLIALCLGGVVLMSNPHLIQSIAPTLPVHGELIAWAIPLLGIALCIPQRFRSWSLAAFWVGIIAIHLAQAPAAVGLGSDMVPF